MKKGKTNIEMYEEVAKKLNLNTERVQSTPHRKPLLISNTKKFFLINTKSPGFYPEARRWNAHFTSSKLLTQKVLKKFGYHVIETQAIRIADFPSALDLRKSLMSAEYQFPILIKPDRGQDGQNIAIAETKAQLTLAARTHFSNGSDFLIQPIIRQTEYRILIVDNEVVLMHSKHNQSVIGDGVSTIAKLLSAVPEKKKDPVFIQWQHTKHASKPTTVLPVGTRFEYHLTKIPTTVFYETKKIPPAAKKWALTLAQTISSPVVGIDVFIPDSFMDTSAYTIIELNTNPAVYYLPTRCNDSVTPYLIIEKVLRNFFNLK